APLSPDQHAADVGADNCAHSTNAQPRTDASGSQIRWVIGRRKCVESRLAADNAPARNEHDDAEQSKRDTRLADHRNADDRDGEARGENWHESAARDNPGKTERADGA